ncbi:MAG: SDR family NAD(P)-dependent oxidoreductase [Planctomycetota bacterium]|nr:SDR family NAD(P)-dependent oxidoreductase [Planctomycetota bacterium]
MPGFDHPQDAVVITGTSSGIGAATARYLHERGYFVFAGIRQQQQADALTASVGRDANLLPVVLDVTRQDDIVRATEIVQATLSARGLRLAGLVNNAADEHLGPVEVLSLEVFRREIEVGYLGAVAVTKAFLPMLRSAAGRIINMSSVNGRCTFKYHATTCATKYAIEAFSDALRMEVRPWGMHVSIIEPGPIDTPLMREKLVEEFTRKLAEYPQDQLNLYFKDFAAAIQHVEAFVERISVPPRGPLDKLRRLINGQGWLHSPLDVARVIEQALTSRRPKTRYLIGTQAKLIHAARRLLSDRAFDRVLGEKVFDF